MALNKIYITACSITLTAKNLPAKYSRFKTIGLRTVLGDKGVIFIDWKTNVESLAI